MKNGIDWDRRSIDSLKQSVAAYGMKAKYAVWRVAKYWEAVFEAYAKQHAPWTDQTGNARQTLHAFVTPENINQLAADTVTLYLAHGMDYGLWLEVANAGRYGIIWDTIAAHLEQIAQMLKGIFR